LRYGAYYLYDIDPMIVYAMIYRLVACTASDLRTVLGALAPSDALSDPNLMFPAIVEASGSVRPQGCWMVGRLAVKRHSSIPASGPVHRR
jgi:hypothetical protein